jgi:hypothetical protein
LPNVTDKTEIISEAVATLAARIESVLSRRGVSGKVVPLPHARIVSDATDKFVLRDTSSGKPIGFILCSSSIVPEMVSRGVAKSAEVRAMLGSELSRVVLDPILSDEIDGLSFAVFPYCAPLSKRRLVRFLERRSLRPALLKWLAQATRQTRSAPVSESAEVSKFWRAPLQCAASIPNLQDHANHALARLDSGNWRPRFVLSHNDLWIGNVLRAPPGSRAPFVVIDWGGATPRGYAMFDLVRLGASLGLSAAAMGREVALHCEIIECAREDAGAYLLAALGHIGLNLENFPRGRFHQMAMNCWTTLTRG